MSRALRGGMDVGWSGHAEALELLPSAIPVEPSS